MSDSPNPTRNVALALLAVHALLTTHWVLFRLYNWMISSFSEVGFSILRGVGGACTLVEGVLLLALVMSCDRRGVPALMLGLWFAVGPLEHVHGWTTVPLPILLMLFWIEKLMWAAVLIAVAAAQTTRVVPVAVSMAVSLALLGLTSCLRFLQIDSELVLLLVHTVSEGVGLVGLGILASGALSAERRQGGWPVLLLGLLPLFRLWLVGDFGLSTGSYGYIDRSMWARLFGAELASLALWLLAFWGISRRGAQVGPFFTAVFVSLGLAAVAVVGQAAVSEYRFGREYLPLLSMLTIASGVAGLVAGVLQVQVLRSLAKRFEAERLVQRANIALVLMATTAGLAFAAVVGPLLLQTPSPMVGVMALFLGLSVLLSAVSFVGMWMFLCFGLARHLNEVELEPSE